MSDDRLAALEARFAWLERHIGEQDRAMMEMAEELRRLRGDIARQRERAPSGADPMAPEAPERPPHY